MKTGLEVRRILRLSVSVLLLFTISCERYNLSRKSDLVAYFPFNGTSFDHSGNNLHGELINGATTSGQDIAGRNNNALKLDGIDDYFQLPDHPLLRLTAFTISLWMKFDRVTSTSHIFNKSTFADNANQQYSAFIRPPYTQPVNSKGYEILFDVNQDGKCTKDSNIVKNGYVKIYQPDLEAGTWYHFVFTFDKKVGKIYINEVARQSVDKLSEGVTDNCSGGTLRFGVNTVAENDYNYLQGSMDDIRIYNRALSQNEVSTLYQNTR